MPGLLVRVLIEARLGVFRLGELFELEVTRPESGGSIAGEDLGPHVPIAGIAAGNGAVGDEVDVALVVGVIGIPHRHCGHAEGVFELGEIGCAAHSIPLFEHLGTVDTGDAHCDCDALVVEDYGAVDAVFCGDQFGAE